MNINKFILLLTPVALVVLIVGYIFVSNYLNSTELTITGKNLSSYEVTVEGTIVHTSSSGNTTTARIPKHTSVSIAYKSTGKYADGTKEIAIKDKPETITITPYFSEDYLMSLLDGDKAAINDAIFSYKSNIKQLYSLENHRLYHFGDWASVKLGWRGDYKSNSDDLKVILEKHNDTWVVISQPSLLFYYKNYPDIPIDILESINTS